MYFYVTCRYTEITLFVVCLSFHLSISLLVVTYLVLYQSTCYYYILQYTIIYYKYNWIGTNSLWLQAAYGDILCFLETKAHSHQNSQTLFNSFQWPTNKSPITIEVLVRKVRWIQCKKSPIWLINFLLFMKSTCV